MKRQSAAIMCWITLFSSASFADDLTIPNTFQANTPARAAEVNANFSAVEASVDDNAADIAANTSSIATNASDIQTLNASVAATGSGGTGLSVLFYNPPPGGLSCEFSHFPSQRRFWWNQTAQHVYFSAFNGTEASIVLRDVLVLEDSKAALVDLMIRIGNLNITVDDMRDPSTNAFVCTNEKLLSVLP